MSQVISEEKEEFTITWQNLEAFSQIKSSPTIVQRRTSVYMKTILNNLNGIVTSGQPLAVLGVSGSGKTALLRGLCGCSTPGIFISGSVYKNNKLMTLEERKKFSYLPPTSLYFGTLTVQEHMMYQALLRLDPDIPYKIKKEKVENILIEMNLKHCANKVIGIPPRLKGILPCDRRKLAFATTLLESTNVIMCDNPATNLELDMAVNVVLALKQLSQGKRVVICSLKEPVSEVMAMFNHILVLWEGNTLFMGEMKDAFEFFNSVGFPFPYYYNPADHIIKLMSRWNSMYADKPFDPSMFCDQYSESEYAKSQILKDEDIITSDENPYAVVTTNAFQYRLSWCRQFHILLSRSFYAMSREPMLTTIQLGQAIAIGFIFFLIYYGQKQTTASVHNINNVLFLILTNVSFQSLLPVVFCFSSQMDIFVTEHQLRLYSPTAYLLARTINEFQLLMIIPMTFTTVVYWSSGLTGSSVKFLTALGISCMAANISHAFGQMISCISPNVTIALSSVSFLTVVMMFFGGLYVHVSGTAIHIMWVKYLSWFYYCYENLVINQWDEIQSISCDSPELLCYKNGTTVIHSLGFRESSFKFNFIMMAVLLVVFRIMSFFFLCYRIRGKKWVFC